MKPGLGRQQANHSRSPNHKCAPFSKQIDVQHARVQIYEPLLTGMVVLTHLKLSNESRANVIHPADQTTIPLYTLTSRSTPLLQPRSSQVLLQSSASASHLGCYASSYPCRQVLLQPLLLPPVLGHRTNRRKPWPRAC